MSFKAVLFDLDGTLLDTLEDLADSANNVLSVRGLPVHAVDAYRYFVGDGLHALVERILPADDRTEETVFQVATEFKEVYSRNWHNKSRMYDGVDEMLDSLQHAGIQLSILSNKPHEFTCICVQKMLASWTFEPLLGARPDVPAKPDPTAAVEIAVRLGMQPAEILYLGDTATDMKTAIGAGMYPVGALWGFRTSEELKKNGAAQLITRPQQLLELFS